MNQQQDTGLTIRVVVIFVVTLLLLFFGNLEHSVIGPWLVAIWNHWPEPFPLPTNDNYFNVGLVTFIIIGLAIVVRQTTKHPIVKTVIGSSTKTEEVSFLARISATLFLSVLSYGSTVITMFIAQWMSNDQLPDELVNNFYLGMIFYPIFIFVLGLGLLGRRTKIFNIMLLTLGALAFFIPFMYWSIGTEG